MGSYRISVPAIRGGETRPPGDTTPPVESYDLGQKIRAAISAGFFAFVGLTIVLWVILLFAVLVDYPPPWQTWIVAMALAAIIGTLVMCWFGFGWSKQAATRPWVVDDKERARRHKQEDDLLQAQKEAAKAAMKRVTEDDDVDGNLLTLTDEQRLDQVAIRMLERVYIYDRPATRDVMCEDGVCLQAEWNLVNAGMKAIGVRSKKSWEPLGFQRAWELWHENVKLETDAEGNRYLMILKSNGDWYALERVE